MQAETPNQGTYFITLVAHQRRRVFQTDRNAGLFIETIAAYRAKGLYRLHAFVVMPDHVHLLLTTNDATIERVIGMIKGGFSHRLGSKMPVWQSGYRDRRCRDADEFIGHRNYINQNPVRAGFVEEAHLYPYSSAYRAQSTPEAKASVEANGD